MDEITSPRRGRPRKTVADAIDVEQAGSDVADDIGLGQAVNEGSGIQAVDGGTREVPDWDTLKSTVRSMYKKTPVSTVWHPESQGDLLDTIWGNVRVLKGESAYQLASGEKVSL